MSAQRVPTTNIERLALDFPSWHGGVNRLPFKDPKVLLFESPASTESPVKALLQPLPQVRWGVIDGSACLS